MKHRLPILGERVETTGLQGATHHMPEPTAGADLGEQARLEVLRGVGLLDTPAEERFDRLTRLAARLFDVPIALVNLVDANRLWSKSCVGLSAREHDRQDSFCATTILGDDMLVLPDTAADQRFSANPLVTEAGFRFYAGLPLRGPGGAKVGTFCLIDTRPAPARRGDAGDTRGPGPHRRVRVGCRGAGRRPGPGGSQRGPPSGDRGRRRRRHPRGGRRR